MGKLKDEMLNWAEMYESGIPMIRTTDHKNWFDVVEKPVFNDGFWYKEKVTNSKEDPIN